MNCPVCQTPVLVDDVNLERMIAKCRKCNDLFRFGPTDIKSRTAGLRARSDPSDGWPIAKIPRPERVYVEESAKERRIVRPWFTDLLFVGALIALAWNGGVILWLILAFESGLGISAFLCPSPLAVLGLILAYLVGAGFLNRTIIGLSDDSLFVVSEPVPLPWAKNYRMPIAAIEQFYCTYESFYWDDEGRRLTASSVTLNVLVKDGSQRELARGLPRDHGLFIEQQLEEWLKISPARIPGQVE